MNNKKKNTRINVNKEIRKAEENINIPNSSFKINTTIGLHKGSFDGITLNEITDKIITGLPLSDKKKYKASGVWKNIDQNISYKGQWIYEETEKNGIKTFYRHGYGEMIWENGDIYSGEWNINRMGGYGIMKYRTEDEYSGQWKNGMLEGEGLMTYKNGHTYRGSFSENMKHGRGIMRVKIKRRKLILYIYVTSRFHTSCLKMIGLQPNC